MKIKGKRVHNSRRRICHACQEKFRSRIAHNYCRQCYFERYGSPRPIMNIVSNKAPYTKVKNAPKPKPERKPKREKEVEV